MTSDSGGTRHNLATIEHEVRALLERRRYPQAQLSVSRGLLEFPDSTELQYLAAFIDYAQDRDDAAMQGIKAVLAQAPQHYGARRLCAHLHEHARELVEAERMWIDLLRDHPQSADCYAGYGELMLKTLNLEKAQRLAEEGLRQSPDHAECLYLATMIDLIRGGRGGRGIESEHLQRMLREHPEQVRSAVALAIALSEGGNDRGALRVAQQLLRNQPDSKQFLGLVRQLKIRTHWSMLPLYPMQRWRWAGAIGVTLLGITAVRLSESVLPPTVSGILLFLWVGYVVYSWTWPGLLRRLI
jgi:tetratricopeptide (TPR) repeat protein